MLNQILQARAEEVIELIYNEIRRSGYEGLLPAGVVLTGGSAQLPRFDELMRWRPGPDEADVRGFEWYYWNRQRHGERRTVALAGGFGDCLAAALSPDGTLLGHIYFHHGDDSGFRAERFNEAARGVRADG